MSPSCPPHPPTAKAPALPSRGLLPSRMAEAPSGGLCVELAEATSVKAAWSVFFPRDEADPIATAKGRNICFQCPVQLDCLAWGMQSNGGKPEEYGILGGTTGPERKLFAKAMKRSKAA